MQFSLPFFCCLGLTFILNGCGKAENIATVDFISGKVTDEHHQGLGNIRVQAGTHVVITDADGNWQLERPAAGLAIAPMDSAYLFSPALFLADSNTNNLVFMARQKSFATMFPESVLAWLNATQLENGLVETGEHSNLVSLYDNALSALAFMASGEYDKAEKIFDFFNARINTELIQGHGGFSQFRDAGGTPNGHNWLGDNAWLLIALNNYAAMAEASKYKNLANSLHDWIVAQQDPADGGIWGGYEANGTRIGKVTEVMIDAFDAIAGYTSFHQNLLQYFHQYRWDANEQLLVSWPGNYYKYAMDNHSWGYCALRDLPYTVIEKADRYQNTQQATNSGIAVSGFAPDIDKDVVWTEGTCQMAVAYRKAGHPELSEYFLREVMKLSVASQSFARTQSLTYAANAGTGYGSDLFWPGADTQPSTAPAAWFLMAMLQFDPLETGYDKPIPEADKFWLQ